MQDAEDIIQETFLSWLTVDQSKIENTKAYLTRMVVNKCLNHLKALNQRKQEYIENFRSFELFEKYDFVHLDISHEISEALSTLQVKLKPIEKAVFILREVFDFEYEDLQEILDEHKDYCRQLLHRAKQKLAEEKTNFSTNIEQHKELLDKFKNACSKGQFSPLVDHLLKSKVQ